MFGLNELQLLVVLIFVRETVHGSHIIHGDKVLGNSMQYMVSVQSNGRHACGGFLISEDIVVTAAHCNSPESDLVVVVVGNEDIRSSNVKRINTKYRCQNQDYKNVGLGDDIMLLKLSAKVSINHTVPIPTSAMSLKDNQICSVAGWGKTEAHHPSHYLRVAQVLIINPQVCQNQWDNTLPHNVICAGGYATNKGFCQGDSGGPLVCNGIAVGVVSFNRHRNCIYPDVPNVYTDISKYLPWINRNIQSERCVL